MTTARDLCSSALEKLGVLYAGETMTADQSTIALDTLNDRIDEMATERLTIFRQLETTKTLSSGTGQYTVGSGGDFDLVRPVFIEHWSFRDTSTSPVIELPLQKFTDQNWQSLTPKTLTSTYPTGAHYNPTFGANALGTVDFWPVPTSSTLTGVLYTAGPAVTEFSTLDATVSLPPGYRKYLQYQLALDLAPAFGGQVGPEIARMAQDAERKIKRVNLRMSDLHVDRGALPQRRYGWSIYSGP